MVPDMKDMLRKTLIGGLFTVGVVGSVATGEPAADISNVSDEIRVALDASAPDAQFDAFVTVNADSAVSSGTGQIGLTLTIDSEASGSLTATMTSSNGDSQTIDIVDTQAQGSARIALDAFSGCAATSCEDGLAIDFARTDSDLEGTLGFTFSLDALVSTESETGGDGSITFEIN